MRSTLESVPGVVKVDINFEARTATCVIDKKQFDSQSALAKLTEQDQFKDTTLVTPK